MRQSTILFLFLAYFSGLFAQDNTKILGRTLKELHSKGPSKNMEYLFGQAVDYYPKTIAAYLALGRYYEANGEYTKAFFNYFLAHQNQPNHPTPLLYLAHLYANCGLQSQALAYLQKIHSDSEIPNLIGEPQELKDLLLSIQNGKISSEKSTTFPSPFQTKQIYCQYPKWNQPYGSALNQDILCRVQLDTEGNLSIPEGEFQFSNGLTRNEKQQYIVTSDSSVKTVSIWFTSKEGIKSEPLSIQLGSGISEMSFTRFSEESPQKIIAPSGRADFQIAARNTQGESTFQNTFYWWAEKEGQDVSKKVLHRELSFSPNTFENHRITFFAPSKEEGEQWGGSYWVYASDQPKGHQGVFVKAEVIIDFSQPNDTRLLIEHPGGINWVRKTFEEAFEESRQTNKPMMILASAAWCPSCRRFENSTLIEEEVIRASENFVCYILDIERRRDLVLRWDVFNVPAIIFLSPENLTLTVINYNSPNPEAHRKEFLKYLFQIETPLNKLKQEHANILQKYSERATNDYEPILKLAEYYLQRRDFQKSLTLYQEILEKHPQFESFYLPRVTFLLFKSFQLSEALEKADFFLEKYPKDNQAAWVLFYKASALFQAEEYEQVQHVCLQILEQYPNHNGVSKPAKTLLKMFQ